MSRVPGMTTGSHALARGAIDAGVSLVTGYAGSPTTTVVNEILAQSTASDVQVEWTTNEKAALEIAFGASLAGVRSLLAVKSVGLNIALDPLMTLMLSGCHAGLVLLVGDDPGAWGSQNEQDSRILGLAAEMPVLEPCTVGDGYRSMIEAFRLSEEMGTPVMVRFTRALGLSQSKLPQSESLALPPPAVEREFMRWVVLPVNVVSRRERLHDRLERVRERFEGMSLNRQYGEGQHGVIACGSLVQKLHDQVGETDLPGLRVFGLGTFSPLPTVALEAFCSDLRSVLVLEEGMPLVEQKLRALVQRSGLDLEVYGRESGHVAREGEVFGPHLAAALNRFIPGLNLSTDGATERGRPSRQGLCEGCPYVPVFDALDRVMARTGGRDRYLVVGDPGCMVRSQLPPYELIDVKNSLGSSIGMAAGLVLGQRGTDRAVIALAGDSSFLHSGLSGLIDAVRLGTKMLVVVLDNGTTALSGGQPHPASTVDARGHSCDPVDLAGLAREAGALQVRSVDVNSGEMVVVQAIEDLLGVDGVSVMVARGPCPKHL